MNMSNRPTPETDAEHLQFAMGGFTLDFCRKLERERDEVREEIDIARLEFEEISNDLKDARNRIWQLEKQIEGLNNFANERYEEIQKVHKERDEARELLSAAQNALDSIHLEVGGWLKKLIEYK